MKFFDNMKEGFLTLDTTQRMFRILITLAVCLAFGAFFMTNADARSKSRSCSSSSKSRSYSKVKVHKTMKAPAKRPAKRAVVVKKSTKVKSNGTVIKKKTVIKNGKKTTTKTIIKGQRNKRRLKRGMYVSNGLICKKNMFTRRVTCRSESDYYYGNESGNWNNYSNHNGQMQRQQSGGGFFSMITILGLFTIIGMFSIIAIFLLRRKR